MEDLEGTVQVVDLAAQEEADQGVIAPGHESPPCRILAVDAIATGDVITFAQGQHVLQIVEVELAVGIGEGDEIQGSRLKARAQGCAVPEITRMLHEPYMRIGPGFDANQVRRAIRAAVVDYKDLVVGGDRRQSRFGLSDGLSNRLAFVVSGDNER